MIVDEDDEVRVTRSDGDGESMEVEMMSTSKRRSPDPEEDGDEDEQDQPAIKRQKRSSKATEEAENGASSTKNKPTFHQKTARMKANLCLSTTPKRLKRMRSPR